MLVKNELKEDQKLYGDKRRSPLVARAEAQAMRIEEIVPTESVTVILSKQGWIRSAKGHDVDGKTLAYRTSDQFYQQLFAKSNDTIIFLDSAGKSFSLAAHTLPSARGHGEPLSSRLVFSPGSEVAGMIVGQPTDRCVLASDAGYGFITTLENLHCKNKNGKAMLKCPEKSRALMPITIADRETQFIAALTTVGHLLLFPLAELPELPRGKGNKIIQIPKNTEERVVAIAVLFENSSLTLNAGSRQLTLKPSDLSNFHGERGRRGNLLPRGFRGTTEIQVTEK